MKVIHEWEENRDGILYECKAYEDGHIESRIKEGQEDIIPESQLPMLEMQENIEYLVDLAELQMEGE